MCNNLSELTVDNKFVFLFPWLVIIYMIQRQSSTCNMLISTKKFCFRPGHFYFVPATCCMIFSLQFEFVLSKLVIKQGQNGVDFQCRNLFTVMQTFSATYNREMIIFPSSLVLGILFTRIYFSRITLANLRPFSSVYSNGGRFCRSNLSKPRRQR